MICSMLFFLPKADAGIIFRYISIMQQKYCISEINQISNQKFQARVCTILSNSHPDTVNEIKGEVQEGNSLPEMVINNEYSIDNVGLKSKHNHKCNILGMMSIFNYYAIRIA